MAHLCLSRPWGKRNRRRGATDFALAQQAGKQARQAGMASWQAGLWLRRRRSDRCALAVAVECVPLAVFRNWTLATTCRVFPRNFSQNVRSPMGRSALRVSELCRTAHARLGFFVFEERRADHKNTIDMASESLLLRPPLISYRSSKHCLRPKSPFDESSAHVGNAATSRGKVSTKESATLSA